MVLKVGRSPTACLRARRAYTRNRRHHRDADREGQLYEGYRSARSAFRLAVRCANDANRQEMLDSLERDPWGRPYHAALSKLRARAPPLNETLQPNLLTRAVEEPVPTTGGTHAPGHGFARQRPGGG